MDNDEKLINELLLDNCLEGYVYFTNPSYADAIVGFSHDERLIYDYDKMVEWLCKTENMTEEEASDFISYNTIRALPYMGENAPIIMFEMLDLY